MRNFGSGTWHAPWSEPKEALKRAGICDTIVFFGSARLATDGRLAPYYEAARRGS